MHGVRRGVRPSQAQLEQERKRSAHAASIIRRCLELRKLPLDVPLSESFLSSFKLVDTALLSNPDEYTLWAFRREVLLVRLSSSKQEQSQSSPEEPMELWQDELKLTTRALRNHPKAYPAWQHRLWLLQQVPLLDKRIKNPDAINAELQLTDLMLKADARNFHGWAHRMRVRSIQQQKTDEKELDFVHTKINDDFANYSAWHHRSVLLPKVYKCKFKEEKKQLIRNELDLVRQAFYTEPDVQSVWFYHRWLLAGAPVHGEEAQIDSDILRDELQACEELIEVEPLARYAWLAKAHILTQLGEKDGALETLDKLDQLDPMRKGYYAHLKQKLKENGSDQDLKQSNS